MKTQDVHSIFYHQESFENFLPTTSKLIADNSSERQSFASLEKDNVETVRTVDETISQKESQESQDQNHKIRNGTSTSRGSFCSIVKCRAIQQQPE